MTVCAAIFNNHSTGDIVRVFETPFLHPLKHIVIFLAAITREASYDRARCV